LAGAGAAFGLVAPPAFFAFARAIVVAIRQESPIFVI
jgi:hypothetical protein